MKKIVVKAFSWAWAKGGGSKMKVAAMCAEDMDQIIGEEKPRVVHANEGKATKGMRKITWKEGVFLLMLFLLVVFAQVSNFAESFVEAEVESSESVPSLVHDTNMTQQERESNFLAEVNREKNKYVKTQFMMEYAGDNDWLEKNVDWPKCERSESKRAKKYIIIGATPNNFPALVNWVVHAQQIHPNDSKTIIFDLGLSQAQLEEGYKWCSIMWVKFDWNWLKLGPITPKMKENIVHEANGAWKAAALLYTSLLMVNAGDGCGQVAVTETNGFLRGRFFYSKLPFRLTLNLGVWAAQTGFFGIENYISETGLTTLRNISGFTSVERNELRRFPIVQNSVALYNPSNQEMRNRVLYPYVRCALDINCMAGGQDLFASNSALKCIPSEFSTCHRGSQSVVSILFEHYFVWRKLEETKGKAITERKETEFLCDEMTWGRYVLSIKHAGDKPKKCKSHSKH